METICPYCEKVTNVEKIEKNEEHNIRGEIIFIPAEYFTCSVCNQDFDDPLSKKDPIAFAYKEYRDRKNMVQPGEIKSFRKKFGLTQKDLSSLFGWGGATLSRYENGALQDDAHETTLQLVIKEPSNLIKLIGRNPDSLSPDKATKLFQTLESYKLEQNKTMRDYFENNFANYPMSIENGFKKLDLSKLFNLILFFCIDSVLKTKLNKLLFYADFKHYKKNSTSITGVRYAKYPFGPVPENYKYYFAFLSNDEKAISLDETQIHNFTGEVFTSIKEPDLSLFTNIEIETMGFIKEYFKNFNVTEISDISHKEKGYIDTNQMSFISYKYADELLI